MKSFALALVTLLVCGVRLTDSSAVTAGLFIHYLLGSGESVTLHSPELLKLCDGREGVVSAYRTEYRNAVGRFSCRKDGSAFDLYDFTYAGVGDTESLPMCIKRYLPYTHTRTGIQIPVNLPSMGRCFVLNGYGKPFHLEIRR